MPGVGASRCVGVCVLAGVIKLAVLIPDAGIVVCCDCPGVWGDVLCGLCGCRVTWPIIGYSSIFLSKESEVISACVRWYVKVWGDGVDVWG